jgi:hypothetical protein
MWINAGLSLLTGALEHSSHGGFAFPIWTSSLLLVCAVFIALAVIAVITGIVRLKKRAEAASRTDHHGAAGSWRGITMADGGTPLEPASEEELWANWDPEFLTLTDRSQDL